jgi:hypothetical protein
MKQGMRCHKVRLSLVKNEPINGQLSEHLKTCSSCSQIAEAQGLLFKALDRVRAEEPQGSTPISVVRSAVAMRLNEEETSIMTKMKSVFSDHKPLGYGIVFGVLSLIFFLAVPFPYQRIVGYNVALSGIPAEIPGADLSRAMSALGQDRAAIKVMATGTGFDYEISNLPTKETAREVGAAVAALAGTTSVPEITAKYETVSASLYAQARERMVRIEVDGEGKTDDQIKAEIESKLAAHGLTPAFVFVKTDPDGKRNVKLEIEHIGGDSVGGLETTIEVDSRGKTDAQIEAEVKEKLAQQGHPNASVTIQSAGPDSLREIKIEIQDSISH